MNGFRTGLLAATMTGALMASLPAPGLAAGLVWGGPSREAFTRPGAAPAPAVSPVGPAQTPAGMVARFPAVTAPGRVPPPPARVPTVVDRQFPGVAAAAPGVPAWRPVRTTGPVPGSSASMSTQPGPSGDARFDRRTFRPGQQAVTGATPPASVRDRHEQRDTARAVPRGETQPGRPGTVWSVPAVPPQSLHDRPRRENWRDEGMADPGRHMADRRSHGRDDDDRRYRGRSWDRSDRDNWRRWVRPGWNGPIFVVPSHPLGWRAPYSAWGGGFDYDGFARYAYINDELWQSPYVRSGLRDNVMRLFYRSLAFNGQDYWDRGGGRLAWQLRDFLYQLDVNGNGEVGSRELRRYENWLDGNQWR